jgi:hypothetical protein
MRFFSATISSRYSGVRSKASRKSHIEITDRGDGERCTTTSKYGRAAPPDGCSVREHRARL